MDIILFGDSHLGRFGERLIKQLEGLIDNSTIFNCSAGGFTSTDGSRRADFMAKLEPDVVIFSYLGNDVAPWKNITPKDTYVENMRYIFERFPNSKKIDFISPDVLVADSAQTQVYNSLMHEYSSSLQQIHDELAVLVMNGNDILSSLTENPHVDDGVHMSDAAYSRVVEAFAQAINSLSPR